MVPLLAATLLCIGTGVGPHSKRASQDGAASVWTEPLRDGGLAVALVNNGERPAQVDVIFARLGLQAQPHVFSASERQDWGIVQGGFAQRVEPHSSVWFRLIPATK